MRDHRQHSAHAQRVTKDKDFWDLNDRARQTLRRIRRRPYLTTASRNSLRLLFFLNELH
jgi:hypothetical protein